MYFSNVVLESSFLFVILIRISHFITRVYIYIYINYHAKNNFAFTDFK